MIVALLAALMLSPVAGAHLDRTTSGATPFSCDAMPMMHHVHRARVLIAQAYSLDRWQDATPVKDSERRAFQEHKRCVRYPPERFAIAEYRARMDRKFTRYRDQQLAASSLTPYACGSHGSFAIPCYIVACESGYDWGAYNASGAASVYQLMPEWGRPFPVTSEADKLAHHRIASDLWAGGAGASNWVCA